MTKFADLRWKNADVSRNQGASTWLINLLDLLWVRYNCAKFHHCRICVTDFREWAFPPPSHPWEAPRMPILNRVKYKWMRYSLAEILRIYQWIVKNIFPLEKMNLIVNSVHTAEIGLRKGNEYLYRLFAVNISSTSLYSTVISW